MGNQVYYDPEGIKKFGKTYDTAGNGLENTKVKIDTVREHINAAAGSDSMGNNFRSTWGQMMDQVDDAVKGVTDNLKFASGALQQISESAADIDESAQQGIKDLGAGIDAQKGSPTPSTQPHTGGSGGSTSTGSSGSSGGTGRRGH
jgi:hypothetical protein